MPLPSSKAELLAKLAKLEQAYSKLEQAYSKLDGELDVLSAAQARLCQLEGEISCCDVLAYQIGWADLLLGWEQQEKADIKPAMPAAGFKWNQLGALAQSFYCVQKNTSLAELRDEFAKRQTLLNNWIDSLSEQELLEPQQRQWSGDKWPLLKWIQVNTIAPYSSARTKVRRFKKTL